MNALWPLRASIRGGAESLSLPEFLEAVGGHGLTHPRMGQAERLACRERLPNTFLREKPAPTFPAGDRSTEKKGARLHHQATAAYQFLLRNTKKEQIFFLPLPPLRVLPCLAV